MLSYNSKTNNLLISGLMITAWSTTIYAAEKTKLETIQVSDTTEKTQSYTVKEISTGTKLDLSIRETPQSVTVITQELIKDAHLESIADVANQVVGVSAKEFDSTRHALSARGFDILNLQVDGAVTSWTGGFQAGETQMDTVIFDRVEVIRGATGLMTGAGNPSAAINMVRKHADSKELSGFADIELGRWNKYQGTIDVGGALNKDGTIRGRFIGRYQEKDSFRNYAEDKKTVLYGVIDADLTENTLFSIGTSYQNNDPKGTTWGGLSSWFSDGNRTNWGISKSTAADWTTWSSIQTNYFATLEHYFDNIKLHASYVHSQKDADLSLLYLYGSADKTTGEGLGAYPYWSQTTRKLDNIDIYLSSPFKFAGQTHEITAGIMHNKQTMKSEKKPGVDAAPIGNFYNWDGSYPEPSWGDKTTNRDIETKQTGLYAVARFSLADEAKLILGSRLSNWDIEGSVPETKYSHDQIFTPYAGLLYDLNKNHTAYLSYTSIFNPQDKRSQNGKYLDPIEGNNYEAGIKGEYMEGKLNAGLSIFKIEQDKLAQADGENNVTGELEQAYYEAEGTTSQGFELELFGEIQEGWNLSFGYSQFKAEDAKNKKVNTSHPRKMAKLFTTYKLQGSLKDLIVGGGINWESENYKETKSPTGEATKLEQKSYSIINLMARYQIKKNISAQLNIRNLLDKKYYSQIGFFNHHAFGEPRNITMNVQYRF